MNWKVFSSKTESLHIIIVVSFEKEWFLENHIYSTKNKIEKKHFEHFIQKLCDNLF